MFHPLRLLMLLSWVIVLSACNAFSDPLVRINVAMPLDRQTQQALDALQRDAALLAPDDRTLDPRWQDRLAIRALTCASGYRPRWWEDEADIREALTDAACFEREHTALIEWIARRHAGLLLSAPPLRPLADKTADELVAESRISEVSFARHAGIAVLHTRDHHEVFDLATGRPLSRIPRTERESIVDISDNGRLLSSRRGNQTVLLDLESGQELLALPSRQPAFFLGDAGLLIQQDSGNALNFMDLWSDHTERLPLALPHVTRVTPTPVAQRYALLGNDRHALIDVDNASAFPRIRVILENESPLSIGQWPRGNLSADGTQYLGQHRGPAWIDLATLVVNQPALQPLQISRITPTADPASSYVFAHSPREKGLEPFALLYSTATNRVIPLEISRRLSSTVHWASPLKRNALMDGIKLVFLPALTTRGEAKSVGAFLESLPDVPPDPRLYAANDEENLLQALLAAQLRRNVDTTSAAVPDAALTALAQHAVIQAVGVYEGDGAIHGHGKPRTPGNVRISVKAGKPVILVLSAYEPVNWLIQPEPGAKILAVLHGGYHPGNVFGVASTVRIQAIGQLHAHQRSSAAFAGLDAHIRGLTGKPIAGFQGSYSAAHFRVTP